MSLQNILFPNSDNLFCNDLTCSILNANTINISGGVSLSGNITYGANLDVSGNILTGGYISGNNTIYSHVGSITAASINTAISSSGFPNSVNVLSGNNLGNITFTLPNAQDIINSNGLSALPNNSTFTFLMINNGTGTSAMTLASSLSGTTQPSSPIYLPVNTSGSSSRVCLANLNNAGPSFTIY